MAISFPKNCMYPVPLFQKLQEYKDGQYMVPAPRVLTVRTRRLMQPSVHSTNIYLMPTICLPALLAGEDKFDKSKSTGKEGREPKVCRRRTTSGTL